MPTRATPNFHEAPGVPFPAGDFFRLGGDILILGYVSSRLWDPPAATAVTAGLRLGNLLEPTRSGSIASIACDARSLSE